jgi:hypothetical protein
MTIGCETGRVSIVSLELSNRMLLLDREPFSATLVRAGRVPEVYHIALRKVRVAALLFEALLELSPALYTA